MSRPIIAGLRSESGLRVGTAEQSDAGLILAVQFGLLGGATWFARETHHVLVAHNETTTKALYPPLAGNGQTYHAAAAQNPEMAWPSALVRFNPDVSGAEISKFLADNSALVTDGPRAGDIYRVRLPEDALAKLRTHASEDKSMVVFFAPVR